MLYLILAHDATDDQAPARRQRVRPRHLEGVRPLVDEGRLQVAGALLDEEGVMRGSMLLLEAEGEAEVRTILERDVYAREGVWARFEIWPFARAV
ncbi:MAG: YciI family protein [Trueperaceae bacterium]|nr:YciI family protein [Trueperaceae bacterium]